MVDIIKNRIDLLRKEMRRLQIDIYIVPSTDFHNSEYIGEFFKCREFITGFTGSAGTAVITLDKAFLWTDGRYFIQAETELKGTGVSLCKMGEPGVLTVDEFLSQNLPKGGTIGFDGRTVSAVEGRKWEKIAQSKNGSIYYSEDLIGNIWRNRPALSTDQVFELDNKLTGETTEQKISRVRKFMKKKNAEVHLLSSLDDIAWLLNIRGNDIAYCPLVLSHLLIYNDKAILFIDENKLSDKIKDHFLRMNVSVHSYFQVEEELTILKCHSILIDPSCVSYKLYHQIPKHIELIEDENPEIIMKCVKNDVEVRHIKEAHIKDAVAYCKFLYWLSEQKTYDEMTEISVSDKLLQFRKEQEGFIESSFAPISAFGPHGAIVHYSATEESNAYLNKGNLLLMDTGAHYFQGTTDITRTISIGDVPQYMKSNFTLVLRAMLRLMNTVFLEGCSGTNLDCIAREVLWKAGKNYNHGTGHGVGNVLNVHEGPINFRYKESATPTPQLCKNMVITDEPGLYIEDSHGIRIENELLVVRKFKNEFGTFMGFEPLTLVPIDLSLVLVEEMDEEEIDMLNSYHQLVYNSISSYLEESERQWLSKSTSKIER